MAPKPNKQQLLPATILFLCLVIMMSCCKSSDAIRVLLNDFHHPIPSSLAAAEPGFNIVLLAAGKDKKVGPASSSTAAAEKDSHDHHAGPCEIDQYHDKNFNMKTHHVVNGKLGGRYGALLMNVLPKGRNPASGPSRRNNDIKT